jgi:hypothetical protein
MVSAQNPESIIGVAAGGPAHLCLALTGPPPASGARIALIEPDSQRIRQGRIGQPIPSCSAMARQDFKAPYYEVILDNPTDAPGFLAIAILDDRYPAVRARSCTSQEGLHLTLWSGEPLRSTRVWHAYWYLGYDVAPDCQPADYQ